MIPLFFADLEAIMANTTYSLALTPAAARSDTCDIMSYVFQHAEAWRTLHNCVFVSAVVNGANLDVIFSNPVPLAERRHIKLSLS